jgi:plasmid stability protein
MMRTTLNLPDDIHEVISSFAAAKGLSLGDAAAELIRKGLRPVTARNESPFPCFAVREGAEPITLAQTLTAEDEE